MEFPERVLAGPIVLRHFTLEDAPRVFEFASDRDLAKMTAQMPHPYLPGMAEEWIRGHVKGRATGGEHPFAITRTGDGALVGSLGLRPDPGEHGHFGYWVGKPHSGAGYATAATRAAIATLFRYADLDALWATHLVDNIASGRVMEKCALRVLRRELHLHRGTEREFYVRGITRNEWERQTSGQRPDPQHT